MKRIFIRLVLTVIMVFTISSLTLAAPSVAGESCTFFAFNEYAPLLLSAPSIHSLTVGVGYTIFKNFATGAELQLYANHILLGGFTNYKPNSSVSINAEIMTSTDLLNTPTVFVKIINQALFNFEIAQEIKSFSLGVGIIFISDYATLTHLPFVEAGIIFPPFKSKNMTFYANADYFDGWSTFKAGINYRFAL